MFSSDSPPETFFRRYLHERFALHPTEATALGDKFELARYHEAVISHGSVPMKYLPELVRATLRR